MTKSDAYLVGLFDGEGCITAVRRRPGDSYVHVQVTIASETVVRRFESRFGGAVTFRPRATAGGLTLWTWRITGHASRDVLRLLAGHSLTKRQQAQLGIQMLGLTMKGPRGARTLRPDLRELRERIAGELRSLNGARSRFAEAT